jgi:two-component system OmpR family response regulator
MDLSTIYLKTPTVFILDDDKFYLKYIRSLISNYSLSINTKTFYKKEDLIGNLDSKPDLILLDYNLGLQNSVNTTAHNVINDIENYNPNQTIVLLSGESSLPLLEEYNKYRNLEYIVKGQTTGSELMSILNKRVKIHS